MPGGKKNPAGSGHSEEEKNRVREGLQAAREMETEGAPAPQEPEPSSFPEEQIPKVEEEDVIVQRSGEVTLPVGYILPDGTVSKTAYIKGLTGRVRRMVAEPECQKNGGKALSVLLRECVTSIEGVDMSGDSFDPILRLTVSDRDALAIAIRKQKLGPIVSVECPHCKEPLDVDLNDLQVTVVEDTPFRVEGGRWVAEFVNEELGCSFRFRLPDGKVQEKVAPLIGNPVDAAYSTLQLCLLEYSARDDKGETVKYTKFHKKFVEDDIDVLHLDWIDKQFVKDSPGALKRPTVKCEECRETFLAQFDIVDFLFQRGGS